MPVVSLRATAAAFLLVGLGGCASGPEIEVASRGAMPKGGAYRLADGAPEPVERIVSDRLAEHGLAPAEAPTYLVQISYAERPAGTGLFMPDTEAQAWLRAPDLRRKRRAVATLGLSIAEIAGGREVYRASASGPAGSGAADADWTVLLDAMLAAPPDEEAADG